ncbi:MAG TPA: non-canonical purine NTP pyrophosphatase [Phycisphaerae bacterium]|nr:non-canonical purine NTP pyrophosphatase [Phycisphaerae bacterium]
MPTPRDILIATNNPGKFREIVALLTENSDPSPERQRRDSSLGAIRWLSLADLPQPIPEPHEDQSTFLGNATLKATYYSKAAGMWALADDSGLEVDALGGKPGVHSAYFDHAAAHLPREARDRANNAKLIAELTTIPPEKRTARYHCILVLADADRILATADGVFEGRIIDTPRGAGGFGYDPYFLVPELGRTVAELPAEEKNRLSHRGQALRMMRTRLANL